MDNWATKNNLLERFTEKYIPEPNSGCWLWIAGTRNGGYGREYGTIYNENKTMESAHRVSFRLFNGPIKDGAIIRHKCDVPLCVNPRHLLSGTHKDNAADRDNRGRAADKRGEAAGGAKLTDENVREIRCRRRAGESKVSLAGQFNVSHHTIKYVTTRGWKHVR